MRTRSRIVVLGALVALIALIAAPAVVRADAMSDLQARFRQRYPHLVELKQAGTVGETAAGFIDFVKGPAGQTQADKDFVDAENADRTKLYKLIADQQGTTPDAVAKVNAKRNFDKAKPGEWLKGEDGVWKKKA